MIASKWGPPTELKATRYDAGNYTPLSAPLSLEDMDGVAVEIQGYGLNTSDRIALLGENRTCASPAVDYIFILYHTSVLNCKGSFDRASRK